jgi:hypothetical protein
MIVTRFGNYDFRNKNKCFCKAAAGARRAGATRGKEPRLDAAAINFLARTNRRTDQFD